MVENLNKRVGGQGTVCCVEESPEAIYTHMYQYSCVGQYKLERKLGTTRDSFIGQNARRALPLRHRDY